MDFSLSFSFPSLLYRYYLVLLPCVISAFVILYCLTLYYYELQRGFAMFYHIPLIYSFACLLWLSYSLLNCGCDRRLEADQLGFERQHARTTNMTITGVVTKKSIKNFGIFIHGINRIDFLAQAAVVMARL